MVVASADAAFAMRVAEDLASPGFRTYVSTDIVGVEIGGAVKNVIAVGAGLSGWSWLQAPTCAWR